MALQDGAGKPVMMTQQPGSKKWDSWETNEFPALFSLTNEARKWVRTTGWSAAQLGRGTQQPGWRGRVRGAGGEGGVLSPGGNQTENPQTLVLHGCKCRRGGAGSGGRSPATTNQ